MASCPPEDYGRFDTNYRMAIEVGNYRAATRWALRGVRYYGTSVLADPWRVRLYGSFHYRNRKEQ